MINFENIGKWLATLPADVALVKSGIAAFNTPEVQLFISDLGDVAAAYGGQVVKDPVTGRVKSIDPPAPSTDYPGAHGKLMPPGM